MNAPNVLCAQLMRDLFAIAKFLFFIVPFEVGLNYFDVAL